jgi:hypothetical protein
MQLEAKQNPQISTREPSKQSKLVQIQNQLHRGGTFSDLGGILTQLQCVVRHRTLLYSQIIQNAKVISFNNLVTLDPRHCRYRRHRLE